MAMKIAGCDRLVVNKSTRESENELESARIEGIRQSKSPIADNLMIKIVFGVL